jgi:hypothetical protein
MKKMAYVLIISIVCLLAVGTYGVYQTLKTNDTNDTKDSKKEISAETEYSTEEVSAKNQITIESSITQETPLPVVSQQIDDQLQKELNTGRYTFDNPLVVLDPYNNSPLTALAIFHTTESYGVRVTVKGDDPIDDVVGELNVNKNHRIPIVGLYADRENTVIIELLNQTGQVVASNTILVQTDKLPSSMNDLVKPVEVTTKSAYGLIQVSGQDTPYPFAFDSTGTIRWYLSMESDGYGMFPLTNNRFILLPDGILAQTISKPFTNEMYEMDHLGRVHKVFFVEKGVHHDVVEMTPGGNLLFASSSNEGHIEDMVQEIDRETGEIVRSLVLSEVFGDTYVDMEDWAHINTVSYSPETDTVLLSPRNIHSGVKINWSTNELEWILGDPRFWEGTPFEDKVLQGIGDIIWHYQPHSIYEIPQDLDNDPNTIHIMMFDNHWHLSRKVDFYDDNENSFVSFYTINEVDMTVTQPHIYAGVKSKVTSNSLFDYESGRVFSMGGYLDPVIDGNNGMIYEYDYETEDVLNQYILKNTFYRAYELVVNYNDCATPMNIGDNYMKGVLPSPTKIDRELDIPSENIGDEVSFTLKEFILYMKSADHVVSQIEFIGETYSYVLDYSFNGEGESKYQKLVYSVPIPMSNLEADTYQVVITYQGERMNTGQFITINK